MLNNCGQTSDPNLIMRLIDGPSAVLSGFAGPTGPTGAVGATGAAGATGATAPVTYPLHRKPA